MNNQNISPLSYISIGGFETIDRKIPPSEYPALLRWGIKTGYAYVEEYKNTGSNQVHAKDGFQYYVKDKVAFSLTSKSGSPLDIYVYENDIESYDDLNAPSFLAFTQRKWIIDGMWEFDIDAYFYKLKNIRAELEGNTLRDKLRQQEADNKDKTILINRAEASYYKKLQPNIKLLGNNPMELPLGFSYYEHRAHAFDMYNDDITDDIYIDDSKLDTKTKGTYLIEYAVSDKYGNVGKVYREVNVV